MLDEPVSALDVSIQAQILNLLEDLQASSGSPTSSSPTTSAVVRHICDRIAVMYLGKLVEIADAEELYTHPQHPYTAGAALGGADPGSRLAEQRERILLAGDVPSPINPPHGLPLPSALRVCDRASARRRSRCSLDYGGQATSRRATTRSRRARPWRRRRQRAKPHDVAARAPRRGR